MAQKGNNLKSCLKDLRRENADHRWFIPQLALCEILSEGVIRRTLQDVGTKPYLLEEMVKHIVADGKKIFAILTLTDQPAQAQKFIEHGELHDQRLPFSFDTLDKQLLLESAGDFYEKQWELTVPTFHRGIIHKSLNSRTVLPFTHDKRISNGAFGTVYGIELDHTHQQLEGPFRKRLVRKELGHVKDHQIELENLAILSHLRHPNILELLSSYTLKDCHNLVFPRAEGGTLAELLASHRQTTPFGLNETFFIALARLSSAIERVHNFADSRISLTLIGYHHDLRPKNVLVSGDTLVLADFGLSRFKEETESSGTEFREGAGDYRAPECEDIDDDDFPKFVIRRSADIWSFGCIIAEIATYMILSHPGAVQDFKMKRRFKRGHGIYYLFHYGTGRASVAVNEWLAVLEQNSSIACKRLLELVRQMLSIDEKKRPKAGTVTTELRFIALVEVANAVGELFTAMEPSAPIDILIERSRFESWKYAMGLLGQEDVSMSHDVPDRDPDSQFDTVLDTLCNLRKHLRIISGKNQYSEQLMPSSLGALNDRLSELLDARAREKSRIYLRSSMVDSEDKWFQEKIRDDITGRSFDKDIRIRATLKHMTLLAMRHHETDSYKRQLDPASIKIGASFGIHSLGLVQEGARFHRVLVEWR